MSWQNVFQANPTQLSSSPRARAARAKVVEMKKVTKELLYQIRHGAAADGSSVDLVPLDFFKYGTLVEIGKWATGDGGKLFQQGSTLMRYPPQGKRLKEGLKYLLNVIFREQKWPDGHREQLAGFFKHDTLVRAVKLSGYRYK